MCNKIKCEGTMKKTYILPEIQIVHLTPVSMLALSASMSNEVQDRITSSDDFGTKEDHWDDELWDD